MKQYEVLEVLNKHLRDTNADEDYHIRPQLKFMIEGKECQLSIQASECSYSEPRKPNMKKYTRVELGYPNFLFSEGFIAKYAEDKENPKDTIYPYVLLEDLAKELSRLKFSADASEGYYSKVKLVVHNNTIFMSDTKDGDCLVIHPESWEHIKYNIDQQIESRYLEDKDE